jgi:hypothetical protein
MMNFIFTPDDYIALATNHKKHLNKNTVAKTLYNQCNKNQSNTINTDEVVFKNWLKIEPRHCENFSITEELFLFNDSHSSFINTLFTGLKSLVNRKNNTVIDYVFNRAKRPECSLEAYLTELESTGKSYYIYHNVEAPYHLNYANVLSCIVHCRTGSFEELKHAL